jgi:hypothetical protein
MTAAVGFVNGCSAKVHPIEGEGAGKAFFIDSLGKMGN